MQISLGIIGTAFRKDDAKRCSKSMFDAMVVVASGLIDQCKESNYEINTLISGGACGADFVAVKLFLDKKIPHLKLFLPAEWNNGSFKDNGNGNNTNNPGSIVNYYHRKFQLATGINSLSQMQIAKYNGAEFIPVKGGFYARNYLIAKESDILLACTFGNRAEVKSGGTSHCVECYLTRVKKEGFFDKSFHFCLTDGKIYEGCKIPVEKDEKVPQLVTKINLNKLRQLTNKFNYNT